MHRCRLLSRFTKRVVVNFDPDQAGATAAEKSISLLTEEGFEVKVIALEGGMDPDRFVRERGVQEYMAALRGAKRHSEYLIERAMTLFPARTAEAKVKAMNFLLPHIKRMPSGIQRDEFAADAAQKLGIDSARMRQELKQAAAQRLESVPLRRMAEPASEAERVLLRALVAPENDPAHAFAAAELAEHPEYLDGLPAGALLDALLHAAGQVNGPGNTPGNPLDAAPDDVSRAMLAEVLAAQVDPLAPPTVRGDRVRNPEEVVAGAVQSLAIRYLERRQRELRGSIAEAERRGDAAMVETLTLEKMQVDRRLRAL